MHVSVLEVYRKCAPKSHIHFDTPFLVILTWVCTAEDVFMMCYRDFIIGKRVMYGFKKKNEKNHV